MDMRHWINLIEGEVIPFPMKHRTRAVYHHGVTVERTRHGWMVHVDGRPIGLGSDNPEQAHQEAEMVQAAIAADPDNTPEQDKWMAAFFSDDGGGDSEGDFFASKQDAMNAVHEAFERDYYPWAIRAIVYREHDLDLPDGTVVHLMKDVTTIPNPG